MNVFVAEKCIDHEGCTVVGVFSTPELAKAFCAVDKRSDYWVVTEFDLDSEEEKSYEIRHWNTEWVRNK